MSKRNNILLIEDISLAIEAILNYTNNHTFKDFTDDQKTIDAVIRNFEIIGEAASRVEYDFKRENSSIPWSKINRKHAQQIVIR